MIETAFQAIRRVLAAAVLSCPALALAAPATGSGIAPRGPAPAMPSPLASQVRQLKDQAIDLNRHARATALDFAHPAYSRATLYLGVDVADVVVRKVSIRIDNQPAIEQDYTRRSAIDLINNGLATLGPLTVLPGAHTLSARIVYETGDTKADAPSAVLQQEFSFTKDDTASQWTVDVYGAGFFGQPQLRLTQWVPHS